MEAEYDYDYMKDIAKNRHKKDEPEPHYSNFCGLYYKNNNRKNEINPDLIDPKEDNGCILI